MIFGKHINKYYFKYAHLLILGILALLFVDALQLEIPELYRMVINGVDQGVVVMADGSIRQFDMAFLTDEICRPMLYIVLAMVYFVLVFVVTQIVKAIERRLRASDKR